MGSPKSQHIEMVYDTELAVMNATGMRWGKKFCWEVDDSKPGVAAAGGMDKFWKGMQKKSKFKALTGPAAGNCTGGTNPKQWKGKFKSSVSTSKQAVRHPKQACR